MLCDRSKVKVHDNYRIATLISLVFHNNRITAAYLCHIGMLQTFHFSHH